MPGNQGVYVLAEVTHKGELSQLTLELMGLGQELASGLDDEIYAVVAGSCLSETARELSSLGADEVLVLEDQGLVRYNPDIYVPVLKALFDSREPKAILMGHTPVGQDLAPRLAFSMGPD